MTIPNYRNNSPNRNLSSMSMAGNTTGVIPTKDVIAKVKADLQKKDKREKQVEKVIKEQIEIKRFNIKQLNSRCDEATDKVKEHQRALDAKSRTKFKADLMDAEERIQKRAIQTK